MRKFDQRGAAAFEFTLVAAPLFMLMFAIFDFGRYAITQQSLRMLANAGARAMMISCYTPQVTTGNSPSGCTDIDSYMPLAQRQAATPFLYGGGLTPTMNIQTQGSSPSGALTVTASQSGFSMLFPILWPTAWGTAPSASTSVPF